MNNIKDIKKDLAEKATDTIRDYTSSEEIYRLNSFINWWITREEYEDNKIYGSNAIYIKDETFIIIKIHWEETEFLDEWEDFYDEVFMSCINNNVYLLK